MKALLPLVFVLSGSLLFSQSAYRFDDNKVWLEESGCRVTQGDLDHYRFLTEFVLGAPISSAQRSLLRSQVMDACTDRTAVYMQGRQAAQALLKQCRMSSNPAQIGLLSSIQAYAYLSQPEDPDKALVLSWMKESNPVLATDTTLGLVFRLADAYACLNLIRLNHFMLQDSVPVVTNESWQLAIDSLSRQYLMTGQSDRKYLSSMQFVWVQTAMAWQTLDIGSRQEISRIFREERHGKYRNGMQDLQLTEDISRALIEAAGITPDQVIQALGSGRSDLFGWRKLDTLQW
ncbi:MAG: hypothetical protein H6548_06450 [Chitinophagales bacterium]|nr:hypothetical protein [Chitinophagales bacterium]MCB9021740.1 hypothetical protein [Chitinophagales bacterium]MCB9031009.1 hypothetical protein [Chitinophagales bacterium]HQU38371.1 hypothetical protein [Chitinophagales bacterium]HQU75309.1 hypothetical protein [Chitinophagales bacterium]